jgi:Transposase domain (DUF772)
MSSRIIPFAQELRPRLPTIVGNVDYLTLQQQLQEIDSILIQSHLEEDFVTRALSRWLVAAKREPTALQQSKYQQRCQRALRCNILRTLLQLDYREFSCALAGSPLYQWFCRIDALDQVRVPSKSEVQRFAHWLSEEEMRSIMERLLKTARQAPEKLALDEALDLDQYFVDTTCLKANLHFPVDWVLLRDAVRTLMKAIILIRKQGLKERMPSPEEFLRNMNQLCIAMTHQSRSQDRDRGGVKKVLRKMKKIVRVVKEHAQRHRELLDAQWKGTEWTRPQVEQVLKRIDGVLELLPAALKQAHERIIGERPVENKDKILSLYEREVRVIVRGKAGARVEFGNTALLGENGQGLILDYDLFEEQAPADSQLMLASVMRVWEMMGEKVGSVTGDRGFASQANSDVLEDSGTFDALCPRDPKKLKERMKEKRFARLQKRRSQTEARISILQRNFFGRPMRAKGYGHRKLALSWGVLTHNLWKLARMRMESREEEKARKAQAA